MAIRPIDRKGFSLVSLLVTMALLAVFVAFFMSLNVRTSWSVLRSELYTQGLALTQARLESLKAVPFEDVKPGVATTWMYRGDDSVEVTIRIFVFETSQTLRAMTMETTVADTEIIRPIVVSTLSRKP